MGVQTQTGPAEIDSVSHLNCHQFLRIIFSEGEESRYNIRSCPKSYKLAPEGQVRLPMRGGAVVFPNCQMSNDSFGGLLEL